MRRVTVKVLLVEDSPLDAELLLRELQRSGFEHRSERVFREVDYRAALAQTPLPDVILADYTMPTFSGPQALRGNREHRRQRVFHAMMELLQQQALQARGGFILGGVTSGFCQQPRRVGFGVGQAFA